MVGSEEMLSSSVIYYSIASLLVMLLSIAVCWWALLGLKFERFVREPGSVQAKLLHLIFAVILGHQFGNFLLDYLRLSTWFREYF
ncbi:DUF1146 family protein [Paenibacillus alkalitolerans]|uniref:DUF1146 family protein n=1 Tax=Paenibacillus alkalitolerans TaxID=2799335 RepID=UPI0018F56F9F|nr:DUF1146 family protein [Paenibacillus alkalitolerans]